MPDSKQTNAIVTGASSGIGEASAIALAEAGINVVLAARRGERLISVAERIASKTDARAIPIECDVTRPASLEHLVTDTLTELGSIDILVNNAGIMHLAPVADLRVDEWDQMVRLNITGAMHAVAGVLPHMLERKSGHIVNVSSVAGRIVFPGGTVYCATKHFLHAFSEGLRAELGTSGVRVTTIAPGYVATELQQNIGDEASRKAIVEMYKDVQVLQPDDIARAVVYSVTQPPHVSVNEVLVRPTAQAR